MADNFTANAGSGGETFASDDILGVQYPRSKITLGANNTNDGDVSASNPMPVTGTITAVTDITNTVTVDNAGTFATQVDGAALTALQLIDDPVATVSATPLMRVAIFDDADAQITSFGGGTQYAVDTALGATPTGTLAVAIRDDALSALTPIEGDAVGLRVDANGGLWTQDVNSAAILADTASMDTNLGTLAGAVAGSEMQVDIVSGNVTNAGTFAVQVDGAALTALQLIDDAIVVDDAAFTAASGKGVPLMAFATSDVVDAGDIGAVAMDTSRNLKVSIEVDNVGIGGGTQYTEDAAAAADPVGNAQILVRADTPATVTSTDGDNIAQRGTNYGAGYVQVVTSTGSFVDSFGGSGGTSHTDDAAFSIGSASSITPVGYLADETTPDSVDEGDVGVARMTLSRKAYAVLSDPTSENNAGVDASGHLQVDIAADSVGIGGGTQYAVDDALGATPTGTLAVAIRDDALSALTPVEGDAIGLRVDANGALWTIPSGTVTVDNGGTFAVQAAQSGTWNINNVSGTVSLPTGAATEATLGSVQTAVELIDDAVHADDAAFTLGTSKGVMVMGFAGTQSVDANDAAALACDTDGALHIADGGNSITVDNGGTFAVQAAQSGSWTVDLGATDNAVLDQIDTNTDYGQVTGSGTETGALRVTIATDSTGVLSVDDNGGALTVDNGGTFAVQAAQSGTWTVQPGNTANTTPWLTTPTPSTSGGLSIARDIDLDNGTLTVVKASAGQLYGMTITNTSTATVFVKFYNAASGTLGTGTPVLTIGIPGNSTDDTLYSETFPIGVAFSTGICVGAGTGVADADNTDPGTNAVVANIFYK